MPAGSGISPEDQAVFDRLTASLRAEATAAPAGPPPAAELAGITNAVDARSWRWVSFMAHGGGTLLVLVALVIGMAVGAGIGYFVAVNNSSPSRPHTSSLGRAPSNGSGSGGGSNGAGSGAALAPRVPGVGSTATTTATTTTTTMPAAGVSGPAGPSPSTGPGSVGSPFPLTTTVLPPGGTMPSVTTPPATVPPATVPPTIVPPSTVPATTVPPSTTTIVQPTTTTIDCPKPPQPPRQRRCGQR
jgi:hypothetical protein